MNLFFVPLDNVSFYSKISVQKWKYVFQRRVSCERVPGKEALN